MNTFNKVLSAPIAVLVATLFTGGNIANAKLILSEDFSGKNKSFLYNKVKGNSQAVIKKGYAELTLKPGTKGSNRVNIGTFDLGGKWNSASLNFRVYLPKNWEFGKGGKFLGLGPSSPKTGCGSVSSTQWSVRANWKKEGQASGYTYHQEKATNCGDKYLSSSDKLKIGAWNRVSLYIKLNGKGKSNGIIEYWINGFKVVSKTDVVLRASTSGKSKIQKLLWNTFFGGSNTSYSPSMTMKPRFDDIKVYSDEKVIN